MSSSAGALTRVQTLADVERPEDLPPEIAEELATLVAERRPTVRRWLKDMLPRGVLTLVAGAGLAIAAPATLVFTGLLLVGLGQGPWRRQPLHMLDERLRELGLKARARRRVRARLVELVGDPPRTDPAERPSAARLLAHLAPQRDRLGGDVAPPVMTPTERERDDLRLAALGYLRSSRPVSWFALLSGAGLVLGGSIVATTGMAGQFLTLGLLMMASGGTVMASGLLHSHGNMRRAIPRVRMSLTRSLRLWKRMRRTARQVDKRLPDTERAQRMAALLVEAPATSDHPDAGGATPPGT